LATAENISYCSLFTNIDVFAVFFAIRCCKAAPIRWAACVSRLIRRKKSS
jgi:hypothetical protein